MAGTGALARVEAGCAAAASAVATAGVLAMIGMAVVILLDVLGRWLFSVAFTALNEVVSVVMAVAVAASIPAGLARRVNLRVDLLGGRIGPRLAAWLDAAGAVMLLAFFALLAWRTGLHAEQRIGYLSTVLRIPLAPSLFIIAALFAAAVIVQALVTAQAVGAAVHAWRTGGQGAATGSRAVTFALSLFLAAVIVLVLYAALDYSAFAAWARGEQPLAILGAFVVLWGLMLGLIPVAAIMGLIGLAGSVISIGAAPAISAFATEITGFLHNSEVAVLPLFLLMGSFASVAGLSNDIFALAHAVFGRMRGGLALATIAGCAGFGAVTGSSVATAATIGRIALPEMTGRGYAPALAAGTIAAGGTLGQLVPPSTALIVYALLTETSIGALFVAAMGPALLAVLFYLATVAMRVRLDPGAAPTSRETGGADLGSALRRGVGAISLFAAVIGGLYAGVFTATESAAVGAVGAFGFALARGRFRGQGFWAVMSETTATTAMIYGLIFGALTFSFFISATGLLGILSGWIATLDVAPLVIVFALLVTYTLLGAVMDTFAIMMITVPIIAPVIQELGYDLVWWGIVMLVVVETGMITPPFGLNLFVLKSVAPDISIATVYRGAIPFVIADMLRLILLVLVPAIALWLPSTIGP